MCQVWRLLVDATVHTAYYRGVHPMNRPFVGPMTLDEPVVFTVCGPIPSPYSIDRASAQGPRLRSTSEMLWLLLLLLRCWLHQ